MTERGLDKKMFSLLDGRFARRQLHKQGETSEDQNKLKTAVKKKKEKKKRFIQLCETVAKKDSHSSWSSACPRGWR